MGSKFWRGLLTALCVLAAHPALAQTLPTQRTIDVVFSGVVADPVGNSIRIRQPDGSYAAYTGPVPEYPYKAGDAVSVSFKATVPTKAYYDSVYQGQIAADGIYRFKVTTPSSGCCSSTPGLGYATAANISGPIEFSPNYGEPSYNAITLVYDYNNDTYSLEGGGGFLASSLWGPGMKFDATTGQVISCTTSACAPPYYDYNSFALRGDGTGSSLTATNIGIYNPASDDPRAGLYNLTFSGSWNLPQFGGGSGGGTGQVPEPAMLLLFALACGVVVARRGIPKLA